jgi:hypothetical protein
MDIRKAEIWCGHDYTVPESIFRQIKMIPDMAKDCRIRHPKLVVMLHKGTQLILWSCNGR